MFKSRLRTLFIFVFLCVLGFHVKGSNPIFIEQISLEKLVHKAQTSSNHSMIHPAYADCKGIARIKLESTITPARRKGDLEKVWDVMYKIYAC